MTTIKQQQASWWPLLVQPCLFCRWVMINLHFDLWKTYAALLDCFDVFDCFDWIAFSSEIEGEMDAGDQIVQLANIKARLQSSFSAGTPQTDPRVACVQVSHHRSDEWTMLHDAFSDCSSKMPAFAPNETVLTWSPLAQDCRCGQNEVLRSELFVLRRRLSSSRLCLYSINPWTDSIEN